VAALEVDEDLLAGMEAPVVVEVVALLLLVAQEYQGKEAQEAQVLIRLVQVEADNPLLAASAPMEPLEELEALGIPPASAGRLWFTDRAVAVAHRVVRAVAVAPMPELEGQQLSRAVRGQRIGAVEVVPQALWLQRVAGVAGVAL
jgi:hypothetical protein